MHRPKPGQVISYAYLWRSEANAGLDEGFKDRPCAVVLVIKTKNDEDDIVVLPITHSPPRERDDAIEIPHATKRRLGLDDQRSWIVLTEANRFRWPGPDIRPLRGDRSNSVVYGDLPNAFFELVKRRFAAAVRAYAATLVQRSE